MSTLQVRKLHLWTSGDLSVGLSGEAAEITAPSWLINAADYDHAEFKEVLEDFRSKICEAFSVIWPNVKVNAVYDFELLEERQVG
ncbi:TPA: hypothetical protein ACKQHR_001577 [Pseudomonas aeruginosa]|nr:hypothetical protein [Pseudomonas aeruginosa]